MPKPTFWNLADAKREALLSEALVEFSERDYNSASLSKIVERLGIAKGSMYQYFADKQDLFLYVLEQAQAMLMSTVQADPPPQAQAGFFETLRWQMSASVRAALAHPRQAALVRRAYADPLPFRDQMIEQARALRQAHWLALIESGQQRGELAQDLDGEAAVFFIDAVLAGIGPFLLRRLGLEAHSEPQAYDSAQVEAIFDQVLALLRGGLSGQPT